MNLADAIYGIIDEMSKNLFILNGNQITYGEVETNRICFAPNLKLRISVGSTELLTSICNTRVRVLSKA